MTGQRGKIYTETVIHAAPAAYVNDAPYQIAIVQLTTGRRVTVRIQGERVAIGDSVICAEVRKGVAVFEKER